MSEIKDIALAPSGHKKIEWVSRNMPILNEIKKEFEQSQCLKGMRVLVSVHVEAKTAYFAKVLASAGAEVTVTGCNPLSTQDDVAAALVEDGLSVFTTHGETEEDYNRHLNQALDSCPHLFVDDGGDITHLLHTTRTELIDNILGGSEETTTGIVRLRARSDAGKLAFPMIAANDADCKHLFDNRYGTGQSVFDGIDRTTNLIVAGKCVVIAGYGWCGKGCAMRAKGLGARVIVTEIDPIKAIEAQMDGFSVMTMDEAAAIGDIFITVTGCADVITGRHFDKMHDGVIMCNAGHFDVEINKPDLKIRSTDISEVRQNITCYTQNDGRRLNLLAEGRLVNLAAGDGHPAEIMDMSFSIQALCIRYVCENYKNLKPVMHKVPAELDKKVAGLKLKAWGINIDKLTKEQEEYLSKYQ